MATIFTIVQELPVCFSLFDKVLAAKSFRKLSDSIYALGENNPCLSTVCKKTLRQHLPVLR